MPRGIKTVHLLHGVKFLSGYDSSSSYALLIFRADIFVSRSESEAISVVDDVVFN